MVPRKSRGILITCLTSLYQASNIVLLSLHDLMLEAESGRSNTILVIKDNVKGVLLATDAVTLTTFTLYLNLDE